MQREHESTYMEQILANCEERFEDEDLVEACEMGAQEVAGAGRESVALGDTREEAMMATDHLSDSARFANTVSPNIRALAGCEDHGYGTYTDCDEKAQWKEDELWDAFYEGVGMQVSDEYDRYA